MVQSHSLRNRKSGIYIRKTWRDAAAAVFTESNISKTLARAVVPGEMGKQRFINNKNNGLQTTKKNGFKCDGEEEWKETKERKGKGRESMTNALEWVILKR